MILKKLICITDKFLVFIHKINMAIYKMLKFINH